MQECKELYDEIGKTKYIFEVKKQILTDYLEQLTSSFSAGEKVSAAEVEFLVNQSVAVLKLYARRLEKLHPKIGDVLDHFSLYVDEKTIKKVDKELDSFDESGEENHFEIIDGGASGEKESAITVLTESAGVFTELGSLVEKSDNPELKTRVTECCSALGEFALQMNETCSAFVKLTDQVEELSKKRKQVRNRNLFELEKIERKKGQSLTVVLETAYRELALAAKRTESCQNACQLAIELLKTCSKGLLDSVRSKPTDSNTYWLKFLGEVEKENDIQRKRNKRRKPRSKTESTGTGNKNKRIALYDQKQKAKVAQEVHKPPFQLPLQLPPLKIKEQKPKVAIPSQASVLTNRLAHDASNSYKLSTIPAEPKDRRCYLEMMESVQDAGFHLNVLASAADLLSLCLANHDDATARHLVYNVLRSTSLMSEQLLTTKLFKRKSPTGLEHDHFNLCEKLGIKEAPSFFKCVNYGSVFTRYPNQTLAMFQSELIPIPTGISWVLGRKAPEKEELVNMIVDAVQFFESQISKGASRSTLVSDKISNALSESLKGAPLTLPSPKHAKQFTGRLNSIQKKVNVLSTLTHSLILKYQESKDQLSAKKTSTAQEVLVHLKGLSDSLETLIKYPQTRFLLTNGDRLLTHLQYLDEQMETLRHMEEEDIVVHTHDLELHRTLSDQQIPIGYQRTIEALNTIYGAQYPNRRLQSIKGYNLSAGEEKRIRYPESVTWRLNAAEISTVGDSVDLDMIHVGKGGKETVPTEVKKLWDQLIEWTDVMVSLSEERIKK